MNNIEFRFATREDLPEILAFIKDLAVYEKMLDEVSATEELLEKWIFDEKAAEVIFAVYSGELAGFALFFNNFSTFLGKAGLYLEDVFVRPQFRGKGVGVAIMKKLASIAKERGYGRVEWICLDWNEPSINFYKKLGAIPMDEWTIYRLTEEKFAMLAD